MTIKETPIAICTKCEHPVYNSTLINKKCTLTYIKSGNCKGINRSMLAPDDWKKCTSCNGSGYIDKNDCTGCRGAGWICIRKHY